MERQYQILIIDDDNDILSRYQVYFTKQGFTVKVAHDGIEGLEKLREIDFDVALVDINMDAGIVTPKSAADALHVALTTVAGYRLIISWNFKHIVHFQKIPLYRAVNVVKGYSEINIYSPLEVINYES
jgi:ActR/RegA family two-component response regulator